MKKLAIIVSGLVTIQSLCLPSSAVPLPSTASETVDGDGTISGKASLKVIGPLHVSEGMVIMRDNQISVLSDATDPIREAELSGQLLHVHAIGQGTDRSLKGYALFTEGYSISALDGFATNETIKVSDGDTYLGHILNSTTDWVRIRTNSGIKSISTRDIVEVKSPRAFEFSIVANNSASDAQVASAHNQITFNPTLGAEAAKTALAVHASTVHRQLSERHVKRRLLTTGVVVSTVGACIAIPFGMALFTPRPNK